MKKALITGITGQDGSYLAEFLLEKGYEVHGIKRRSSSFNTERIDHIYRDVHADSNLKLHYGDMIDSTSLIRLVHDIQPDEVYNLAAQSHVKVSWECPEYTADCNALGTLRLLEAIKMNNLIDKTRFFQASTSELYGLTHSQLQNEKTSFYPRSPYAAAKLYAYWITVNYRESFNMYALNGILFNHESPRRGGTFVTKKITSAAAKIKLGLQNELFLGNLDAKRDWGHSKDYMRGVWQMLQQESPEDYVLATGVTTTIRDFCKLAFKEVGIDLEFKGVGVDEVGVDLATGNAVVKIDARYFRPTEVDYLCGDSSKAKEKLGWEPEYDLNAIIKEMVAEDLKRAYKEKLIIENGGMNE